MHAPLIVGPEEALIAGPVVGTVLTVSWLDTVLTSDMLAKAEVERAERPLVEETSSDVLLIESTVELA